MDENLKDPELLTLFLEEASDRLDRVRRLTSHAASDEVARTQLRRELHALKGAGRMLGLTEIADACHGHAAEDLLEVDEQPIRGAIGVQIERLEALIEGLHGGDDEVSPPDERESSGWEPRMSRHELRVPTTVVDDLADRGARLRVVSAAAEGLVDRLFSLASLAEGGAGEPDPGQALAALAISLRQVATDLESGQRILRRLSNRQFDALLRFRAWRPGSDPGCRRRTRHRYLVGNRGSRRTWDRVS
ncbi:MAG: Hpt domain-containing protein [Acidobacteriota bacterium]